MKIGSDLYNPTVLDMLRSQEPLQPATASALAAPSANVATASSIFDTHRPVDPSEALLTLDVWSDHVQGPKLFDEHRAPVIGNRNDTTSMVAALDRLTAYVLPEVQ